MNKPILLTLLVSASLLAADNSDLKTKISTLEQQIDVALNKDDLLAARHAALELVMAIGARAQQTAPSLSEQLSTLELSLSKANARERFYVLQQLPRAAFNAQAFEKAGQYANELLISAEANKTNTSFYGDAVFEGHTILGRVKLKAGDIAGAKNDLNLSLNSAYYYSKVRFIGPNFGLAQDLLARGERDSVQRFLSLCKQVWVNDDGALDLWIAAIKGGGLPKMDSANR